MFKHQSEAKNKWKQTQDKFIWIVLILWWARKAVHRFYFSVVIQIRVYDEAGLAWSRHLDNGPESGREWWNKCSGRNASPLSRSNRIVYFITWALDGWDFAAKNSMNIKIENTFYIERWIHTYLISFRFDSLRFRMQMYSGCCIASNRRFLSLDFALWNSRVMWNARATRDGQSARARHLMCAHGHRSALSSCSPRNRQRYTGTCKHLRPLPRLSSHTAFYAKCHNRLTRTQPNLFHLITLAFSTMLASIFAPFSFEFTAVAVWMARLLHTVA